MKNAKWWLPLVLLALITPFASFLDLKISEYFYQLGNGEFVSNRFYHFLYHYGTLPANLTVAFAIIVFILSFFILAWKKWRYVALMLIATMLTGGWLITHEVLKEYWGRPRPKQVIEFGGSQPFRPYYSPNFFNQPEPSKSFTCGHCVSGFFFFAVGLAGRRLGNRYLYIGGMALALILGILLSWMRIALGGHFLTDILFSALIMWYSALFFDWLIFEYIQPKYGR